MTIPTDTSEWLNLDDATQHFGYGHAESLRGRLRTLRERGLVIDLGNPPEGYKVGDGGEKNKVVLLWPHPLTVMIRSDAPRELLNPKRGKRKAYGKKGR